MLSIKSKEIIKTIAEKYDLILVILFGGMAQGVYDRKSNIELAILPKKSFRSLNKILATAKCEPQWDEKKVRLFIDSGSALK